MGNGTTGQAGIWVVGSHRAGKWLVAPGAGLLSPVHCVCGLCFLWGHTPVGSWEICILPLAVNWNLQKSHGLGRATRADCPFTVGGCVR